MVQVNIGVNCKHSYFKINKISRMTLTNSERLKIGDFFFLYSIPN